MKKVLVMALAALVAFGAQAQEKKDNKKNANQIGRAHV